jgi:hypothetical protein
MRTFAREAAARLLEHDLVGAGPRLGTRTSSTAAVAAQLGHDGLGEAGALEQVSVLLEQVRSDRQLQGHGLAEAQDPGAELSAIRREQSAVRADGEPAHARVLAGRRDDLVEVGVQWARRPRANVDEAVRGQARGERLGWQERRAFGRVRAAGQARVVARFVRATYPCAASPLPDPVEIFMGPPAATW